MVQGPNRKSPPPHIHSITLNCSLLRRVLETICFYSGLILGGYNNHYLLCHVQGTTIFTSHVFQHFKERGGVMIHIC